MYPVSCQVTPQTYTTGHCRKESRDTRFRFAGFATMTASENHVRPRAFYQSCTTCSLPILTLGGTQDVRDAFGLCLSVVIEHKRHLSKRDGKFDSDVRFDEGNVLGELFSHIWHLYQRWNPAFGAGTGTFRGYSTAILRQKIKTFVARDTGEVSGGRKVPKAHAYSVSSSLEGLIESEEDRRGTSGLDFAFGPVAHDPTFDLASSGGWLDAARGGTPLRVEAGRGGEKDGRPAPRD